MKHWWRFERYQSMMVNEWRKMLCFRVDRVDPLFWLSHEMKEPCYDRVLPLILRNQSWCQGLKEIWWGKCWRKMLCFRVSIGLLPLILTSWNETLLWRFDFRVDVNDIWRKMLCFRVGIGLLPLILIVSWNETLLWRFERNQSWCQWDMKENVVF